MRQELIDLLLGELDAAEAEALKARVRAEPELRRELLELESLLGLMRRGEEVEPLPETRAAVLAAAAGARVPLLVRLRAVPGLVAYRFRRSPRFRVAMISLCAHVVVIAVLAQILLRPSGDAVPPGPFRVVADEAPATPVEPEQAFLMRLSQRRVSQSGRLRQYGVKGQENAIGAGLDALLLSQRPDGSFGDSEETAYAALALLAQGEGSAHPTPRGRAVRKAMGLLLADARRGAAHGAMLAALVEDYGLSYPALDPIERMDYVVAIRMLLRAVPEDDISREAMLLARIAGFDVPAGRLGEALIALATDRSALLGLEPTRLRATAAMARGRSNLEPDQVARWVAPLFERALADLRAGRAGGLVLLTLQSPYRL